MNKLISFFKKWQNVLKSILFLSISILVLLELIKNGKDHFPGSGKKYLKRLISFSNCKSPGSRNPFGFSDDAL